MYSAWQADIFKTAMHRTCGIAHGSAEKRKKIINEGYDFTIINYDGTHVVFNELVAGKFDLIIVDEANAYKTVNTRRWKTLAKMLTPQTWLWMMTGTPASQSPIDAFGLARLVSPQRVPKFTTAWRDKVMYQVTRFKWLPKDTYKLEVFNALQPAIRHTKKNCLDLPELTYQTREVPLTPQVTKYYKTLKQQIDDIITAAKQLADKNKQKFYLNDEDKESIRLLENAIWKTRHTEHKNGIRAKGVILNNNKLKTIFILEKVVNNKTNILSVSAENSNRIIFFNNTYGTIDSKNLPFNIWGISDKNVDFDTTVKDSFSAFGEGNYGYGSLITDPPVLYNQEIKNRIYPFIDEIDITKNSSINTSQAKIIKSDNKIENVVSRSSGFGFKFNDMQNVIEIYNNIIKITNNNEELSTILSKILADASNQVYKNNDKVHYCVEIDLQDVSKISDYGKIIFQKDIEPTVIYNFFQKYEEVMRIINTRLPQIGVKKLEIEKHGSAGLEGHLLLTLSLNYRLGNLWRTKE
jgi:hypothetical protein